MYRFPSAQAAYAWAMEILSVWRDGKAFDPDPEQFRGNTGRLGAVIVALDIERMAKESCSNGAGNCPYLDPRCLMEWFMPDPKDPPPRRSRNEVETISICIRKFERKLQEVRWIE